MQYLHLLFLFCAILQGVTAYSASPVQAVYDKHVYRLPMRDGVRLHTTVYTPKSGREAPILIFRTPYGTGPYEEEAFPERLEKGYLHRYIERGYIIVEQDVRGRYQSEGEFVHVRPAGIGDVDEITDSYDTVEWLVKHVRGNNGRVGFAGASYPGFYALMGGLCGHRAVCAISPQAPVTDWYMGDDVCHHGVLMLSDAVRFLNSMNSPAGVTPASKMPRRTLKTGPDERTFFLERYATRSELTELLAPNPFWEQVMAHPEYDAWWRLRDTRRLCRKVRPAVLVVGGTFDAEDGFGAWNLHRAIARQSRRTPLYLVMGPWSHGAWRRSSANRLGDCDFGETASEDWYLEHFELPFFDRYLLGHADAALPAKVSVFSSGDNRWHHFDRWPAAEVRPLRFYLAEQGVLSEERPRSAASSSEYLSDPMNPVPYVEGKTSRRPKEYMVADQRFLEGRDDVLSFMTPPLTAPVTCMGAFTAELEVALSTSDADFIVKLIDVFPDEDGRKGRQMLVRGDVVRGRFREGCDVPKAVTPDVPVTIPFRTTDVAHTFLAGHRILVQIQSSWFPLLERNPQQFVDLNLCRRKDFIPCRVTLFHERSRASSVTLEVLPVSEP